MRHPVTARLLGLVVIAMLVATACTTGPAATEPPADESPAAGTDAPATDEPTGGLPEPELDSIQIGLNGTEASQFALAAATMLGILERNGIEAEFSTFEGDGQVAAALQSGQLDFVSIASAVPISSQLTDAPMVALGVTAQVLTDHIVCLEEIETTEDVVGGRVAISTFGGTSHGAALLGIEAMGLTTDEVTITQVGGQGERIAALEGGSIECAVVDANLQSEMEAQGFNILADLKAENVQWGRSTLATSKEWLADNPNTALVILASALEAQNMYFTDPETMAEAFAELNQISIEEATVQIEDFQEIGNRDLMWSDEAFTNPQQILAAVESEIGDVNVEEAFDRSYLQQLVDIGYYEELGVPIEE